MGAFPLISVTVMPAASLWVTELLPGTPGYLLSQLRSLKLLGPLQECLCLNPCTWSYNLPQKKGFLYGRLPLKDK